MTAPPPEVVARLRAAGCVFAEDEARLLLDAASDADAVSTLVEQRAAGLPLEHVLGWAEFDGARVAVDPGVFVPRHRSEHLVARAAVLAPDARLVVDLCAGTGALGLAVLRRLRHAAALHAVDVDPAAVACAARNLGTAGRAHLGDLWDALPADLAGRVDLTVVSAPYVPTDRIRLMPPEARDHEARVALDGGPDGLDVLRRVAAGAGRWLAVDGLLVTEVGADQGEAAVAVLTDADLDARVEHDEPSGATLVLGHPAPP